MKKIAIDYSDMKQMIGLMNRHNEFNTVLVGENTEGERTYTSINENNVTVETHQSNGWIRTNVFHRDGTAEELYSR